MLFWRRLGNCSKFELKCCLDWESTRLIPESTPQSLELTWHFWSRLIPRNPRMHSSTWLTRVDSWILGVDSVLRARTPDLLSFGLSSLGVDSNCSGVDSALSFRNTSFYHFGLALPWSRLELSGSRLGSQRQQIDLLSFWVALSRSRLAYCGSRLESQSPKTVLWLLPCVPLRVDSHFLWSRPANHRSRLAFHRSRLESQGRKLLSDFSVCNSLESTHTTSESTR